MPLPVHVSVRCISGESKLDVAFDAAARIVDVKRAVKAACGFPKRMQTLMWGNEAPGNQAKLRSLIRVPEWCVIDDFIPHNMFPREVRLQLVLQNPPCAHCGNRSGETKYCSGCSDALYCGAECQRQHWVNNHKHVCDGARLLNTHPRMA